MVEARYDYAGPYKTYGRASDVLDHLFASDQVSEGERPVIEKRAMRIEGKATSRYFITLPM